MRIITVPCLQDNYAYLIDAGTACAVVDPSEPEPVMAALKREGLTLSHILNTHHHGDHTGGNRALKTAFGAKVVGPAADAARIPGIDIGVGEKDGWEFAGRKVQILEVPAHTRGAITFVMEGNAFTGDTLFVMGCGRLFEGDAAMMHASLAKLAALPDQTRIWCGHEYAAGNGRFALTLEPGNQALQAKIRNLPRPSVPSTMAEEKATNPFLRTHSVEIRKTLGMEKADAVSVFAEIRSRKDRF
jgi:hydroxyacylglutathione hydrolase